MSYFPYPREITSTEARSNQSVDGVGTNIVLVNDAVVPTGNSDFTSIIGSITRVAAVYGGFERDTGNFYSLPDIAGTASYNFSMLAQVLATGTDLRVVIGSSWTGAGNTLSDGIYILEFTA